MAGHLNVTVLRKQAMAFFLAGRRFAQCGRSRTSCARGSCCSEHTNTQRLYLFFFQVCSMWQESYFVPARLVPQWLALAELFVREHGDAETTVGTMQRWLHKARLTTCCFYKRWGRASSCSRFLLPITSLANFSLCFRGEENTAETHFFRSFLHAKLAFFLRGPTASPSRPSPTLASAL